MLVGTGEPEPGEEADEQATFFMSYNHLDEPAAHEIVSALEKKGYSVWIAGVRIAAGEFISQRVREAIQEAKGLILYLSAHSLRSPWVAKEQIVGEALTLDEPLSIIVKGDDADLMVLIQYWLDPTTKDSDGPDPGIPLEQTNSFEVALKFRNILENKVRESESKIYLYPDSRFADGNRLFSLTDFPECN
jgi:hypothetical protein